MNPTKQYNLIFYLWQKNKRKEQKVKKKIIQNKIQNNQCENFSNEKDL